MLQKKKRDMRKLGKEIGKINYLELFGWTIILMLAGGT